MAIPERLGRIVETWQPSDHPPSALVVHLQDLHTDAAAQTRLAELIGYFHDRLGIRLAALEGAEGPVDTSLYADFPNKAVTGKIAKLFLQHGLFTGAQHLAITHPGTITLWGAEDEATYLDHIRVFQEGAQGLAAFDRTLSDLQRTLRALEPGRAPRTFQAFISHRRAFREGDDAASTRI